jgi:hypothetical protein
MQKSTSPGSLWAVGLIAGILVLAGCADVLQGPSESQGNTGEGRVTITIDAGARTLLPSSAQFSRFEVTGTKQGGTQELEPVEATGGSAELVLPVGAWDVQVWAYNQAEPVAIVAQAANTLTNTGGEITGNTHFVLEPTGIGPGVLAYRITKPEGSIFAGEQSRIQIEQNGVTVKTIGFSDSVAEETSLEPGRYIVDIVLGEGTTDKQAAQREIVVILPGLTTAITFAPTTFVEPVDTLTFTSLAEYRAYIEALPINTADTPYRVKLTGIALEDLQEGEDPLGQVFAALGPKWKSGMTAEEYKNGRYIALDLSGCTGTAIGTLDSPVSATQVPVDIDANIVNRQRLVSLTFPSTLESIGHRAFYYCKRLESVALPESLKVIGYGAFQSAGLTSVELPDSVERIGIRAFAGPPFENGPLTSVKLSASLKELPTAVFAWQGFNSIELPQGLEVIGPSAFSGTSLQSINFPDTLTTIEMVAFGSTKQLESITLPASITPLGSNVFSHSEVKSVDFSACVNLKGIMGYMFNECTSLTEVKLPPNITYIGDGAFIDCALPLIDLPPSVEVIDERAFEHSVNTLIVRSVRPPGTDNTGRFTLSAGLIYVPDGSVEAYKAAEGWIEYAGRIRPLSEYPG